MITTNLFEPTTSILFFCLEIAILLSSLGVVLLRRVIYSALLLGVLFVCIALFYLLLNADFLAAAQVLIYVGAINVLILFAIMLVANADADTGPLWATGQIMSALLLALLFALLIAMISITSWGPLNALSQQHESLPTPLANGVELIGFHLLTDALLPFELLSLLLLIALVGAIMIARRDNAIG